MENNETTIEMNTESTESQTLEGGEQMDAEGQALSAEAEAAEKAPAWIDFCAALEAHAQALGLSIQEQKGFKKFVNLETGHKLYVAKGDRAVKRVDTTLPILGQDGTYDLSKPNGKIACHVVPDLETVTKVLTQLADSSVGKIRQAKRAPKAAPAEEAASEQPAAE